MNIFPPQTVLLSPNPSHRGMEAPASGDARAWRARRDAELDALMEAAGPAVSQMRPAHLGGTDADPEWQSFLRRAALAALQASAARSQAGRFAAPPTVADVQKRLVKLLRQRSLLRPAPHALPAREDGVVAAIDALLSEDLDPSGLVLKVGPRRGLGKRRRESAAYIDTQSAAAHRRLAADLRDEKGRRVAVLRPTPRSSSDPPQQKEVAENTCAAFRRALVPGSAVLSTIRQLRKLRKHLPPPWQVFAANDGLVFYHPVDRSFTRHNPLERVENESLTATNLYVPTKPSLPPATPHPSL